MAKKYSAQDILRMSVGLLEEDLSADLDADGKVTSADARIAMKKQDELPSTDTDSDSGIDTDSSASVMAEDILDKIINRTGSFSYDINEDKLYGQYKDMYKEEGRTAAEDIFGLASSLTGGWGNSYALKLSGDVLAEYSKKADSKKAELEKQAYERFNDETEKLYSLYEILADKEYSEKKLAAEKIEDLRSFAFKAADIGDYSLLKDLGIDTSGLEGDEQWDMAELLAKYSDYSGLKELGVDLSKLTADELLETGELFAKYGDYTLLKLFGVNTENREKEELLERLLLQNKLKG